MELLNREIKKEVSEAIKGLFADASIRNLVLTGPCFCGKKTLLQECLKENGGPYLFVDLRSDSLLAGAAESADSIADFIRFLSSSGFMGNPMPKDRIWILAIANIDLAQNLISDLKFSSQNSNVRVAATSSFWESTLPLLSFYPSGSIKIIDVKPMNFNEYLMAYGFDSQATSNNIAMLKDDFPLSGKTGEIYEAIFELSEMSGGLPALVLQSKNQANEASSNLNDLIYAEADIFKKLPSVFPKYWGDKNIHFANSILLYLVETTKQSKTLFRGSALGEGRGYAGISKALDYLRVSQLVSFIEEEGSNAKRLVFYDCGLLFGAANIQKIGAAGFKQSLFNNYQNIQETHFINILSPFFETFSFKRGALGQTLYFVGTKNGKRYGIKFCGEDGKSRSITTALTDKKIDFGIIFTKNRFLKTEKVFYLPNYVAPFLDKVITL